MAFVMISGAMILLLMYLITLEVLLRKFFHHPIPGTYELVQFLFVSLVFFGVAYVQSIKHHIKIDIATTRLSQTFQDKLDLLGYIIGAIITGILAWRTGLEAWKSFITNDYSMGIVSFPLWPAKTCVFLGLFVLTIRLCMDILLSFSSVGPSSSDDQHQEESVTL
jgi:TRAP-type C4-dicarboxylate transport system permease small subunit